MPDCVVNVNIRAYGDQSQPEPLILITDGTDFPVARERDKISTRGKEKNGAPTTSAIAVFRGQSK
jgi:hypothetical protein